MYDRPLTIEQILSMLASAPERLAILTASLPPALLLEPPEPGEWSARDVLAHLRACSDVWGGCIAQILDEDHPTIKAVNPRTWIEKTDYNGQEFASSLRAFTAQRLALLAALRPLSPEAWSRAATVTGAGAPLEKTAYSYALRLAIHERPHVKQIERTVRKVHV